MATPTRSNSVKEVADVLKEVADQKVSPDKHTINTLMDRTYPFRREILERPKPIQQILKDFPTLKK